MNALPVGGERLGDSQIRERYFQDLSRYGFDVAYTAYYAQRYEDVVGRLKQGYVAFAEDARRLGHPVCVQIQSTVCHAGEMDIAEAQYRLDNTPDVRPDGAFFASFASEKWREYLKKVTQTFVQDFGYDWVVFEEPMYRVDIPGTNDRFHALFRERFPDVGYPTERGETSDYLRLQRLKADVLVEFYADLTAYARGIGAAKVGIMPWFFTPTVENTPEGTLNTSCDIGRILAIDGLDFLVVRMQPDNIYADTMRTGEDMRQSPLLYYSEVLAHASSKPLMAVSNPVDEHTNYPELPLISLEFFKKSLLASMAAGPNGMTRHWYGQRYGEDAPHLEFMSGVNQHVNRLGSPTSQVGFLFSHRGGRHAAPYTYETVWPFYWKLARHLLFERKMPIRTLYADALANSLEDNPDLRLLIMEEHFPLSIAQAQVLKQWWTSGPGRAVAIFGAGLGYSADEDRPGESSLAHVFPDILHTVGVRPLAKPQATAVGGKARLKYVGRVMRSSFLPDGLEIDVDKIANVERVFGSRSVVLYVDEATEIPIVVQHNIGDTFGVFCGFGLSESTVSVAGSVIHYLLRRLGAASMNVTSGAPGVLWSGTKTGYVVVTNASEERASFRLWNRNGLVWDVVNRRLLPEESYSELEIEPLSFNLYRYVGKRSKLYDAAGAVYLKSIVDGAGRADVAAFTSRSISFIARVPPERVTVDGRTTPFSEAEISGASEITLSGLETGEHVFTIWW